ncbi:MAG: nitroreductase family protein [Candidatus Bathyarchaeia archaeon]
MSLSALETIGTLRSMRRLKPDRVEQEKIQLMLEAAGKAPSGSNTQPWDFILISDEDVKRKLRDLTVQGMEIYVKSHLLMSKEQKIDIMKTSNPVAWLANNTDKIPVIILACLNTKRAKRLSDEWSTLEEQANWASVFPAVQNLLLAARALGLGTAISIFPLFQMNELKELLKLPEYVKPGILIYVGYPTAPFTEPKRSPIQNFIHHNTW